MALPYIEYDPLADRPAPRRYAWSVFAVLFALMVVDYIDRQVVVSMFPHLKAYWSLSDSQLGGLVSIVSITVALGAVPLSLLADRWSRVKSIFSANQAGIFLGGTIHDVAQVVGAGYSISPEVGDYAVLTKMFRVALLLPVVAAISFAVRHRLQRTESRDGDPLLPFFLLAFLAFVVVGSLGWIPKPVGAALNEISRACLVIAIAAVGLKTSLLEIRKVGARAIVLLGVEAVFLAGFVLLAQKLH